MTRKDRVLRYVNRLRVKHGVGEPLDEMPKGVCDDPFRCPVARAVNGWADPPRVIVGAPQGKVRVRAPEYVAEFIDAFDQGRYPELEALR